MEYLNTYQLNVIKCSTDIHGHQGMNINDFSDPLSFTFSTPAGLCLSYLAKCLNTYQIKATEFCTDVHGPQRMKPNDFGDRLTFAEREPVG